MSLTSAEVTFCNMALDELGAEVFTYADQTTNAALVCNRHYEQTKDSLLRSFEWPFAIDRVELDLYGIGEIVYYEGNEVTYESATVYYGVIYEEDDFQWDYKYSLPTDFLRLTEIYELYGQSYEESDRFEINGSYLYTNLDEVHIKYVKSISDPMVDSLFADLLLLKLELKLMNALAGTKNDTLRQLIMADIRMLESRARAVCRSETNVMGYSSWNNARYGSGIV